MNDADLPWENSENWKKGYWYPLAPGGDIEFGGKELTVARSGWDLFRLDPRFKKGDPLYGDIESMGIDVDFYTAVKIANNVNPERLWTASWVKDDVERRRMVG